MNRVAFQGEPGAFSEEAAVQCCGSGTLLVPLRSFGDVVKAVLHGNAEQGILPIENSLIGTVAGAADAAATDGLMVTNEYVLPIHHCLLARPGVRLEELTRALSHAAALGQCQRFFSDHPQIAATEWYDTAGAAKFVAGKGERGDAAIASRRAAERYKLSVLLENIEDHPDNATTFVVVQRKPGME